MAGNIEHQHPDDARSSVAEAIRERGAADVARVLGISREAVMSFALGVAHDGTDALVVLRLHRLALPEAS